MPSGRDSFRRNRVAPCNKNNILAQIPATRCAVQAKRLQATTNASRSTTPNVLKSARVLATKPPGANSSANKMDQQNKLPTMPRGSGFRRYWPLLAELWIVATILTFFIIRILGSESVRHKFHFLVGR
jgi:hypothetical protein